jgi:N-carbamoyl-L-amino-acid hydrolase
MPTVDAQRVGERLRAFARIGYSRDGAINRPAFSRQDLRARELLLHFMDELGLQTRVDAIGNVFGRLGDDTNESAPAVLVGSHLDTVPGGGRFDGSIGVVAALEIASVLRAQSKSLRYPLEIVSFACEESSRFGRGTIGSGVVAGAWDPDEILALRDARNLRLSQVVERLGLDPRRIGSARRRPGDFSAYLELHIEQGRVLESARAHLGVVNAIAAPTRFRLRLTGRADHSGATPMPLRHDALAGAAEIVLAIERIASAMPRVVGTVGTIQVKPGAINVVPGEAELGIDIRSTDGADKAHAIQSLQNEIMHIARLRELTPSTELLSDEEPVTLSSHLVELLEHHCQAQRVPSLRLASGAGHDAMQMARLCPAGMLLVPSRGGISHNVAEWTDFDHIVVGIQVLLNVTLELTAGHVSQTGEGAAPVPLPIDAQDGRW